MELKILLHLIAMLLIAHLIIMDPCSTTSCIGFCSFLVSIPIKYAYCPTSIYCMHLCIHFIHAKATTSIPSKKMTITIYFILPYLLSFCSYELILKDILYHNVIFNIFRWIRDKGIYVLIIMYYNNP